MYKKTLTILEAIEKDIENGYLLKHTLGRSSEPFGCMLGLAAKNAGVSRSYPSEGEWGRKKAAFEVIDVLYQTSGRTLAAPTLMDKEHRITRKNDKQSDSAVKSWVRRAIKHVRAELS